MKTSILTKKQEKQFRKETPDSIIVAKVRHDDQCGNGHNTFSITGEIYEPNYQRGEPSLTHSDGRQMWLTCCGCCHDDIAKYFPELRGMIRWHLTSTDGPMHYNANAQYWAGHRGYRNGKPNDPPNVEYLKNTIAYGALASDADTDLGQFVYSDALTPQKNEKRARLLGEWLMSRSGALMAQFQTDVESLGFTY